MTSPSGDGAAILLAAGHSSRFGSDKRMATIGEEPMLRVTLAKYLQVFEKTVVVLKPGDEALAAALSAICEPVIATRAAEGMAYSIRAAIEAVRSLSWVVVGLADMPSVETATLKKLRNSLESQHQAICRPRCNGRFGNPVGFPSLYFEQLARLKGDVGARALLDDPDTDVITLDVEDPGVLFDVDEPSELKNL